MRDQAEKLRRQHRTRGTVREPGAVCRSVIAITSGKGGVGKTHVTVNLAAALTARGRRVVVLDADFGLANIDVMLGLTPTYNVHSFLTGEVALQDVLVTAPAGFRILPASSGIQSLTHLSLAQTERLLDGIQRFRDELDLLLVDTAAGISDNVLRLLLASDQVVVVTSPEPTAIVDAYALIKVLSRSAPDKKVRLLVNSVDGPTEGRKIYSQICRATESFIDRSIDYLGHVPNDEYVVRAVRQQSAVIDRYPRAPASQGFRAVASALDGVYQLDPRKEDRLDRFWHRLLRQEQDTVH